MDLSQIIRNIDVIKCLCKLANKNMEVPYRNKCTEHNQPRNKTSTKKSNNLNMKALLVPISTQSEYTQNVRFEGKKLRTLPIYKSWKVEGALYTAERMIDSESNWIRLGVNDLVNLWL
jgi:hypothetical protein